MFLITTEGCTSSFLFIHTTCSCTYCLRIYRLIYTSIMAINTLLHCRTYKVSSSALLETETTTTEAVVAPRQFTLDESKATANENTATEELTAGTDDNNSTPEAPTTTVASSEPSVEIIKEEGSADEAVFDPDFERETPTQSIVSEEDAIADTEPLADTLKEESFKDAAAPDEADARETPTPSTEQSDGETQTAPSPMDEGTKADNSGNISTPKPTKQPTSMPPFLPALTPTASPTASPTKTPVVSSSPAPKKPTTKDTSVIVDSNEASDNENRGTNPPAQSDNEARTDIESFVEKEAPSPKSATSTSSSINENMKKGAIAATVLAVLLVMALIGYHAQRKCQRNESGKIESDSEHGNKICDDGTASRKSRDHEGTHVFIEEVPGSSESHDSDSGVIGEQHNTSHQRLTVRQESHVTDEQLLIGV